MKKIMSLLIRFLILSFIIGSDVNAAGPTKLWSKAVGFQLMDVKIGDINGDGKSDVVVGPSEDKIEVIDNSGNLLWAYPTGGWVWHVAIGDVDGDYQNDVVGYNSQQPHTIYAINSFGNLLWSYTLPVSGSGNEIAEHIGIADINGDGNNEVVVGPDSLNTLYVFDGSGNVLWTYSVGSGHEGIVSVKIGDIDTDGIKDIVVSYGYRQTDRNGIAVLDGTGSVIWDYTNLLRLGNADIGDLDGDNRNDIVVEEWDSGSNRKLYAISSYGEKIWEYPIGSWRNSIVITDIDKNGVNEVVVGNDRKITVLSNDSGMLWTRSLPGYVSKVAVGDINGDGDNEIVAACCDNTVRALDINGNLIWEFSPETSGERGPACFRDLAIGDISADGIPDIVVICDDEKVYALTDVPQPVIIYVDVDATGANDGSNWEDAYNFLQDALADANSAEKPVEIWVAEGIYRPDQDTLHPNGTGDREATFQLINDVAMYGGFTSAGGGREDRDPNQHETILSGDLNRDDVDINDPCDLLDESSRAENSYHVVTGSRTDNTAVLDGFTVAGGNANGPWDEKNTSFGGGIYNKSASPTVTKCTFTWNSARTAGAGMSNRDNSRPTLTNCTFRQNSACYGGGMYNYNATSWTVDNCTFSGNSATSGGGMYNWDCSSLRLINCIFNGNLAHYDGGGMLNDRSSLMLTNCVFGENSTGRRAGGLHNFYGTLTLSNCTFNANSTTDYGGGMYNYKTKLTCKNCILWGDTAAQGREIVQKGVDGYLSYVTVSYSDVEGGKEAIYVNDSIVNWLNGNIDGDPCFVGAASGDYHLLPDSPCINRADPDYVADPNETDIDGEPRVMLGRVDMGADEFNPYEVNFIVVPRELRPRRRLGTRVGRTALEYDCKVILTNISYFAIKNVELEILKASENMNIVQPSVSFADSIIEPGESAESIDTCTFQVDRSEAIDQAEIIFWEVGCEVVDTGETMHFTGSSNALLSTE